MLIRKDVAEKVFPNVKESIADLQKQFPERKNKICSRFAPSPTGFLHLGAVFSSLVARKFTHQEQGTFILRIEDTDQKRQVEGALESLLNSMKIFGISIDEGAVLELGEDIGSYGPYIQSQRKYFYEVFVKELISKGLAYPCWMKKEEIDVIREDQSKAKLISGIYGNYSARRNKEPEDVLAQLNKEQNYEIIRFRSQSDTSRKITFEDILRGNVNIIDNYNDVPLIKGDGLPTYHMAHIVDDHLMRVSHIIRAEEWLTSVPLHLQLFKACDIEPPKYCHLAQILKLDDETKKKRKLSKRKDPEANVEYFFQNGFAVQGIIDYLTILMDSGFENFQRENTKKSYLDYHIELEELNKSGALFDLQKMTSVNNEYLSRISTKQLLDESLSRAKKYNPDLACLIESNIDYSYQALNIERHSEKDPKRFSSYKDIKSQLSFFFDDEREQMIKEIDTPLMKGGSDEVGGGGGKNFIQEYIKELDLETDVQSRFQQLKNIGKKYLFAANNKEFKEGGYIGKVGDLAMFLRLQLCASPKTPDLFSVMKVMGKERVVERLKKAL